ncbi:MAG TPA: 50S ribosomal protein L9, partial [Candidatus Hydrogenedentes bacterium]|nr:50S ribosomal protein L9 [Candidatus Hydrogenedentota bacterium]
MNVILCEDVENLGVVGQKVTVADGYARNFLIPRKLAVPVDAASAKQIEHELRIIRKREERRRAEL